MAECPQCHSSIQISEQSFGTLFTCPACSAVYFVGWDGVPERPDDKAAAFPTSFEEHIQHAEPPPPIVSETTDAIVAAPAWDQPMDIAAFYRHYRARQNRVASAARRQYCLAG